ENARLEGLQADLVPGVTEYLRLLDRGAVAEAQEVLEARIEPLSVELVNGLRSSAEGRVARYTTRLNGAEQDSGWLQWGTALVFLLGLAVLALGGWADRGPRGGGAGGG